MWPGYGDNSRVLKWIFERTEGKGKAAQTAIGYLPEADAIDTNGLSVSSADMKELLSVNKQDWLKEVEGIKEHYATFGDRLPKALNDELAALVTRLNK